MRNLCLMSEDNIIIKSWKKTNLKNLKRLHLSTICFVCIMRLLSSDLQMTGQKTLKARWVITYVYSDHMWSQIEVECLAAAQPKESAVIWYFDLSLSGIYLTVTSRLCLWFKAVCTDPITFHTKEMQRVEMDCSVFTEDHRIFFTLPCIF